jgi:F-type H+-transporting ATPase subunit b
MQLDWSTFILEILNFLILIWILKKLLYTPILTMIAERKAAIEQTLATSERTQKEAQALREQYEHRQADWQREKETARAQLLEELTTERNRLMAELQASLDHERERTAAVAQQRADEMARKAEDTALTHGAQFAARLLARVAGPELERSIVALALEEVRGLPENRRQAIRAALPQDGVRAEVVSAYPLVPAQRAAVCEVLEKMIVSSLQYEYREDRTLVAGIRVIIGDWVLDANLHEELEFFKKAATHADIPRV